MSPSSPGVAAEYYPLSRGLQVNIHSMDEPCITAYNRHQLLVCPSPHPACLSLSKLKIAQARFIPCATTHTQPTKFPCLTCLCSGQRPSLSSLAALASPGALCALVSVGRDRITDLAMVPYTHMHTCGSDNASKSEMRLGDPVVVLSSHPFNPSNLHPSSAHLDLAVV